MSDNCVDTGLTIFGQPLVMDPDMDSFGDIVLDPMVRTWPLSVSKQNDGAYVLEIGEEDAQ